mgnify:FL=1
MISNNVYEELKMIKGDKSFSEILKTFLERNNIKKGSELKECLGILHKDKELEATEKTLKRGWGSWTKKYA